MLEFILLHRKQIAYAVVAAAVAGIVWWFGFHVPAKLKAVEAENTQLQEQVQAGKDAIALLTDIQKGKVAIDEQTFKNISSIKSKIGKPHTVLIGAGRLSLPVVR